MGFLASASTEVGRIEKPLTKWFPIQLRLRNVEVRIGSKRQKLPPKQEYKFVLCFCFQTKNIEMAIYNLGINFWKKKLGSVAFFNKKILPIFNILIPTPIYFIKILKFFQNATGKPSKKIGSNLKTRLKLFCFFCFVFSFQIKNINTHYKTHTHSK